VNEWCTWEQNVLFSYLCNSFYVRHISYFLALGLSIPTLLWKADTAHRQDASFFLRLHHIERHCCGRVSSNCLPWSFERRVFNHRHWWWRMFRNDRLLIICCFLRINHRLYFFRRFFGIVLSKRTSLNIFTGVQEFKLDSAQHYDEQDTLIAKKATRLRLQTAHIFKKHEIEESLNM